MNYLGRKNRGIISGDLFKSEVYLFEMVIIRQDAPDREILHDDKRGEVGEGNPGVILIFEAHLHRPSQIDPGLSFSSGEMRKGSSSINPMTPAKGSFAPFPFPRIFL